MLPLDLLLLAAAALIRVTHRESARRLSISPSLSARSPAPASLGARRARDRHLAWTARRIEELGGRTSLLNPLFLPLIRVVRRLGCCDAWPGLSRKRKDKSSRT